MSKVVSLRLKDDQVERLERAARRMGRPPSSAAIVLLEEALRMRDFPFIEFRDTIVGRQAYIKGTRLQVWMVKLIANDLDGEAEKVAAYLEVPAMEIQAALRYAEAFHKEIDAAIADNDRGPEELKKLLPNLEVFTVDVDAAAS